VGAGEKALALAMAMVLVAFVAMPDHCLLLALSFPIWQ
jgi:hypothetical protein